MTCDLSRLAILGVLAASLLLPFDTPCRANDESTAPAAESAAGAKAADTPKPAAAKAKGQTPKPAAKPKHELTPEMAALRDRVRAVFAAHRQDGFNTHDNTATEIMNFCLAYGCGTAITQQTADGNQPVNGITCLCWNYPCDGFQMLMNQPDQVAVRIGYGYQENPGELLAMLAMSRVPADYALHVGPNVRTVAGIVEAEKRACRHGSDLSLVLIGLVHYADRSTWKNDLGETWSIERILEEEMSQPVVGAAEGGMNRLLGLGYAVSQHAKHGGAMEGRWDQARKYVDEFQEFAFANQNSDGSWGPYFVAARGTGSRHRHAVAGHGPGAGVAGRFATRQKTGGCPRHGRPGERSRYLGKPGAPGQPVGALDAQDRLARPRLARPFALRRAHLPAGRSPAVAPRHSG